MIPSIGANDVAILKPDNVPTRTYRIDLDRNVVSGKTDGLDAMKQAIYLILNTERFIWPIYSWNYGIELIELIGERRYYVESELEMRIRDALMQDDRVISVSAFSFSINENKMTASFSVETTEGNVDASKEVSLVV